MAVNACRMLVLAVATFLLVAASAEAQAPVPSSSSAGGAEIAPETAQRLIETIEDPQRRQQLIEDLRALSAVEGDGAKAGRPAEPEPLQGLGGRLLEGVSARMDVIDARLEATVAAVLAIPRTIADLVARMQQPDVLTRWGMTALKVIAALAAGTVASQLLRWALRRPRRAAEAGPARVFWLRLLQLLGRGFLELLPIVGFAAAAYAVLPILGAGHGERLLALTLVNAHVAARLLLMLARLILVPQVPELRMVPLRDDASAYLYVWIARVATLGVYGYFLLQAARLLGVPPVLAGAFEKLLGLAIAAIAAVLVMQNRDVVARFLRGEYRPPPEEMGAPRPRRRFGRLLDGRRASLGVLRRVAGWWHYLALALIAGLFGSWAFEIRGGFEFLAEALAITAVAFLGAGAINHALQLGIGRWAHLSADLRTSFPGLESRANRYLPVFRKGAAIVVYLLAALIALEAWGLGTWSWLLSDQGALLLGEVGVVLLVVVLAFATWEVVSAYIERTLEREVAQGEHGSQRKLTLLPLFRNVVRISIAVVAAMVVLSEIGINIGPLLAGVGVLGLAVGFGAQALVQDVITGAFMLIEDAVSVGDWIEAGGHSGTVEALSIRTVRLRDLSGTLHIIPFSDVTTISNYNREYGYALIDAGVAYREDYGEVVSHLQAVADAMREDPNWGPNLLGELEVFGLNELGDSAVAIRVRLRTRPMKHWGVRREFLRRMKERFDAAGIEIPFPHRTIWFGVDKDGAAPPARLADVEKPQPVEKPAADAADDAGSKMPGGAEARGGADLPEDR